MSKLVNYSIPCPQCKVISEQKIFHSVNTNIDDIAEKLLRDEINFVRCNKCGNSFHVKAGFLFNNIKKMYAVYYNPTSFEENERESQNIKKMLGDNFYLANPTRFKDWEQFKVEVRKREGLNSNKPSQRIQYSVRVSSSASFNYWTCDICDGDSDSGCMYFDPTECPRH
ncbi:CpXC domain-containing protein [Algoriphagus sp. D3-2-R+10]|uniref:CpXC domain-containing protein n=1 Tax=Algoriphagus aurantiacus TaxID=3103948 RepID=UPI002B37A0B8|nr:CpXC domain-containing protein [Algoriphagus sp. D3-2-R+10]MEB2774563.1 CpXC domain-containing protein [Algoriphagus sp. D3-2-R+10]